MYNLEKEFLRKAHKGKEKEGKKTKAPGLDIMWLIF